MGPLTSRSGLAIMVFLSLLSSACGPGEQRSSGSVPETFPHGDGSGHPQYLVVVTESPGDIQGSLYRMEWVREQGSDEGLPARSGSWSRVGNAISVVVGWGGIGQKREGDGRSPQGVFELGPVFGYSPESPFKTGLRGRNVSAETSGNSGGLLPYLPMLPGAVCVDDPASDLYNRIVAPDTLSEPNPPSSGGEPHSWRSHEAMRRDLVQGDDLYKWGIAVRFNEDAVPGAGSCIFLHIWRAPDRPTDGCTAMAEEDLLAAINWLRTGPVGAQAGGAGAAAGPILVQGTREFLETLRRNGLLPFAVPPPP